MWSNSYFRYFRNRLQPRYVSGIVGVIVLLINALVHLKVGSAGSSLTLGQIVAFVKRTSVAFAYLLVVQSQYLVKRFVLQLRSIRWTFTCLAFRTHTVRRFGSQSNFRPMCFVGFCKETFRHELLAFDRFRRLLKGQSHVVGDVKQADIPNRMYLRDVIIGLLVFSE